MRYGMVIDTNRCIGCQACTVACKSKNNLPDTMWWSRVDCVGGDFYDTPRGTFESGLSMHYVPVTCQHCSMPACMGVCPTGAIIKRDDGIVEQDSEACIGCDLCTAACPYSVRTLNSEEPEFFVDFPLGDWDAPEHVPNTVEKCSFCANRIERGEKPACMLLCPGRARFWGDLDDPTSEASVYLAGKQASFLLEDKGTKPNCYYIGKL